MLFGQYKIVQKLLPESRGNNIVTPTSYCTVQPSTWEITSFFADLEMDTAPPGGNAGMTIGSSEAWARGGRPKECRARAFAVWRHPHEPPALGGQLPLRYEKLSSARTIA
jgi:hypothetical protein